MADAGSFRPTRDDPEEPGIDAGALADENALLRASLAETRQRLAELEETAEGDSLTPLPGRARFLTELERVASHVERHGTQAACLSIDVDGFGDFNRRFGRTAGDAALIHVARLLQQLIRSTDFAARTGGDEFGLILDHLDHNSAIETAERLARCIAAQPLDLGGALVPIRVTIGVATMLPGDRAPEIAERSERNMRRARQL